MKIIVGQVTVLTSKSRHGHHEGKTRISPRFSRFSIFPGLLGDPFSPDSIDGLDGLTTPHTPYLAEQSMNRTFLGQVTVSL